MKTLPLILGFVAAGAVGALAATVMQPADAGVSEIVAPREDPRVDDLANSVERLRQELAELRTAPVVPDQTPVRRMASSPAALESAPVAENPEAMAAVAAPDAKFEKAVEKVVAKTRQREMEAIGKMWTSRAAQREKDMVTKFAEDQGLTDYQQDGMVRLLDQRREKLSPYFRAMFTPAPEGESRDYAKIREDMQKVRDEIEVEMKNLISEDQVAEFRKVEESRRGRWR